MSDDLKLTLELEATGFEETLRNIKDLERRLKAINVGINSTVNRAVNPSSGKGNTTAGPSRDVVRRARETLEIDRDKLRVVKQRMRYEGDLRSKAVKAIEQERRAQERRFQDNLAFQGSMHKQRLAEERQLQREVERTGRIRSAQERRLDQDRRRSRRDAESRMGDVGRYGRESYRALSRAPAAAGAVVAGGAAALGNRALRSEIDADNAEINAQIYGKLSKDAARDLRDKWAAPLAESLGVTTAKLLSSYTDALKLGVPAEGARAFAELNTKVSEAWDVPFDVVGDVLGTVNTILTSTGDKFDIGRLKSVANTLQVLAAGQSTTPEKMIAFLKHGAGAAQVLKMSQEAGLAFGSASTSLGNQAAESGRLFDYMASRLVELPNLVRKRGDEGKDARNMLRAMGYANAQDMDRKRRADPDAFLPDFVQRMHDIKDPKQKEKALRFFAGREWFGEMGRIVEGASTYQEAVKLQKEAKGQDAIEDVWKLHLGKLRTILARIRSGAINLLGEVGKAFGPYLDQFATRFLEWSRKLSGGGITERIKAMFDGLIEGFGGKSLPDLLDQVFGKPGEGSVGSVETFKATAKAFAEGLREVFSAVRGLVGAFTGGSPETIARWTGRIIALSLALAALSPVLTALGAFVAILKTASALRGLSGLAAGRGAGFGAAPLPVQVVGAVSIAGWEIMTRLIDWLVGKNPGKSAADLIDPGTGTTLERPPMSVEPGNEGWLRRWWKGEGEYAKPADDLKEAIQKNTETLQEGAKIQKQAYEAIEDSPFRGLIHKASLGGPAASIGDAIRNNAARAGGGALSGSVGNGPLISSSIPGGSLRGITGMSRRGIMGGGGGGAVSGPGNGSMPTSSTAGSLTDLINQEAARAGIDPRILHGIRAGESGKRADYDVKSDSKEDSYGPFQLNRRGGLGATFEKETGLDARDPKTIPAQTRWVAELIKKKGRGVLRQWYGYKGDRDADPSWGNSGYVPNAPAGAGGSGTASGPVTPGQGGQSASRIQGQIDVEGQKFDFGSGGHKGANSIPYGTYPVTPDAIGPWGRANGALGINGNAIWDKTLGRMRTGIEFHAASNSRMLTAGCIGIAREQYSTFKDRLLSVYRRAGRAFLTVGPNGASISTTRPDDPAARVSADTKRTQELGTRAGEKPNLGSLDVAPQGGLGGKAPLGTDTPIKTAPAGSGGGSAQNGVVNNHVTVNAARHSPDEMASAVQRKLNESMNRRSHDFDQAWA